MVTASTRLQLIDVARKLFAKKGVDNTTMNDIATASKFGRRTLYTYFKSKEELFWAVIENEQERLSEAMLAIAHKNISPDEKIIEIIYTRMRIIREVVLRNGSLHAAFFRDIWMVEHVRKPFDQREIEVLTSVISEGKEQGIFDIEYPDTLAKFIHYCIKGLEVPFIRGKIMGEMSNDEMRRYVSKLIFRLLAANQPGKAE